MDSGQLPVRIICTFFIIFYSTSPQLHALYRVGLVQRHRLEIFLCVTSEQSVLNHLEIHALIIQTFLKLFIQTYRLQLCFKPFKK